MTSTQDREQFEQGLQEIIGALIQETLIVFIGEFVAEQSEDVLGLTEEYLRDFRESLVEAVKQRFISPEGVTKLKQAIQEASAEIDPDRTIMDMFFDDFLTVLGPALRKKITESAMTFATATKTETNHLETEIINHFHHQDEFWQEIVRNLLPNQNFNNLIATRFKNKIAAE
jgi:hypothetical protein